MTSGRIIHCDSCASIALREVAVVGRLKLANIVVSVMGLIDDLQNLSINLRALEGSALDRCHPRSTGSAIIVVSKAFDFDVLSIDFSVFECFVFSSI